MSNILSEIIQLMVGGISGIASGVGQGLSTLATAVFLQTDATTGTSSLSTFGALVVIFAGIGLAIGLCRWVVDFVTSLGARNR